MVKINKLTFRKQIQFSFLKLEVEISEILDIWQHLKILTRWTIPVAGFGFRAENYFGNDFQQGIKFSESIQHNLEYFQWLNRANDPVYSYP